MYKDTCTWYHSHDWQLELQAWLLVVTLAPVVGRWKSPPEWCLLDFYTFPGLCFSPGVLGHHQFIGSRIRHWAKFQKQPIFLAILFPMQCDGLNKVFLLKKFLRRKKKLLGSARKWNYAALFSAPGLESCTSNSPGWRRATTQLAAGWRPAAGASNSWSVTRWVDYCYVMEWECPINSTVGHS